MLLWLAIGASCAGGQPRSSSPADPPVRPICRTAEEIHAAGELIAEPHFRRTPRADEVRFWDGHSLPERPPDPRLYVRCRPCDCSTDGRLVPWDDWDEINRRAYVKLRSARAPYPTVIVPGLAGGGAIETHRIRMALRLVKTGWAASLLLSGGHQRSGQSEVKRMLARTAELAEKKKMDIDGRIFVEPCACVTLTNLRNSLRMMGALRLPHGLLLTDSKMSGQAAVFYWDLDKLVARDLDCPIGRVSHVLGPTPLTRVADSGNGCRARLGFMSNPIAFLLPFQRVTVFWVSPDTPSPSGTFSALSCNGGSERITACEPDDADPFSSACHPMKGRDDLACEPTRP